jgi:DNA-binding IclR family transcriptional regulator
MQAIDRAFTVLRAVASRSGTSTLADVTREAGLPKSTVLRLLIALEDQGAVQTVGGRYAIGPGLAALSHQGAPVSALKEVARPHIVELAERLEENVSLTIADSDATLYIDTAVAESSVMVQDWTGERLPYHASAAGLALMSGWTDDDVRAYAARGMAAFTESTVITVDGLRDRMRRIADEGVVWTFHDFSDDVNGIGCPIRSPGGTVVGALNAYGPDYRFPGENDLDEIRRAVLDTCQAIGERLA